MTIQEYIDSINKRYKLGNATEHTFRGDLQQLIESLAPGFNITNEPTRTDCGSPDYIITKKYVPIGYIEAKDIGVDLNHKSHKEQFDRYKTLGNLVITDYLTFQLFRDTELVSTISIGQIGANKIIGKAENYDAFISLIKEFISFQGQTIKSAAKLSKMMAGKARFLADVIERALMPTEADDMVNEASNNSLHDQYRSFQQILIHDINEKTFADIYSQTIAYGMFAARLHDSSLDSFSRQEAADLIPKTNPFLRKLFQYIAGYDLDDRIKWIVDALADIFRATNVAELLKDFGKSTQQNDPMIHFYETFLTEYDPALRKSRGVFYTPEPVVKFIVRAVDDILKTEFGLPQGLADISKTKIKVNLQETDKRYKANIKTYEEEVHRVQILDPATGTGTFLAEVVKYIYKQFEGQQGIWNNYVSEHLIPRLNGFEILMASYAMAHLKLDMLLKDTGYDTSHPSFGGAGGGRFRIYLTNSLEEHHPDTGTLFANWLSTEANEANYVKRDTPVMVILGNPPYSVSSSNKSKWIENLIADYKKDLNEKNIQPLSDDYIKFIRFGQHFIDKNGSGILAFISNNSFIDGIIHRQMRKHLLESFDTIYIVDLHGNTKKKEVCPDGTPDQNVFDIMQGVSINIFIKSGKKKGNELGKVFHFDLQGSREIKYDFLNKSHLKNWNWNELLPKEPNFFLVKKNFTGSYDYGKGFKINEFLIQHSSGIETRKDSLVISHDKNDLYKVIDDFKILSNDEILKKYTIDNNSRDWKVEWAKEDVLKNKPEILDIVYKPFDKRYIIYTGKTKGINGYPMFNNFKHIAKKENVGLCLMKKLIDTVNFKSVFISNRIMDKNFYGFQTYFFPLYLYPETNGQLATGQTVERTPNLNMEIVKEIGERLGMAFANEKTSPTPPKEGLNLSGNEKTSSISSKEGLSLSGNEKTSSISSKEGLNLSGNEKTFSISSKEGFSQPKTREGQEKPGYITANPSNYLLIKEMRDVLKDNPTEAEKVIWEYLRNKKTGHKIRRQHIIDDFITDFVCLRKKTVIEIDGKIHLKQKEYDEIRTLRLNELGYEIVRYTNEEVFNNPELVTSKIKTCLDNKEDLQNDEPDSPPLEGLGEVFAPIDILDYIYAVLHSPSYREKYKEFLKIDFPRVPYPTSPQPSPEEREQGRKKFWALVKLGGELRQIHLLESPVVDKRITTYPMVGNNMVEKVKFDLTPDLSKGEGAEQLKKEKTVGKVWINDIQYFDGVPDVAWTFYIGGYQPAQKWLKDRKGRELSFEDIVHYQKIVVALAETDRLMKEIDGVEIE